MSRHSSPSPLLLLLMANAVLAFGDNQTTTTNEDQLTEKNNRRIFNTIMKRSKQIPPHRQPTSNHMSHLLGYSGFANSTHITRGNKTCLRIHCVENHYVRSCDFDGGNDTCVRCAQGTFLADNTSSQQFNHECVTYPECFPDATRSLYPNYCAGQHLMYCKCDVTRNFCGHDPCKCTYGNCPYSAPVLRVNCGCDRRSTTSTPTTTTTTKITTTTEEMSSIKSTKMPNVSSTPVHSSPQTTMEQTSLTTTRQTTIKPGGDEEDTGRNYCRHCYSDIGVCWFLCWCWRCFRDSV
ncbi:uncharacterized protein LOC110467096 [Mizuhopecten yessoensis]|uniref:uncharacterized protein LOC110467096 n=1 Tax=Mizuhopecten yessoensis TaxID=6573 RepID=UPI000B458DB3|nr:uncharacterized protein LOC110467096 [Mizuhopecten yessoensis]